MMSSPSDDAIQSFDPKPFFSLVGSNGSKFDGEMSHFVEAAMLKIMYPQLHVSDSVNFR